MARQGAGIANVHQAQDQLQGVDESRPGFLAALDPEAENAGRAAVHIFLCQRIVRAFRQAGVVHPVDLGVVTQELGHLLGVFTVAVHAQRQGFNALQDQEGIHGAQGRTGVTQRCHSGTADEGGFTEGFGIDHAVVGRIRLIQYPETRLVFSPGEFPGIHNYPGHGVAVPAHVFGQRVDHDIRTVFDGPPQIGRGHGIVDDQRHTGLMGRLGQAGDVDDVAGRVTHGLTEDGLGVVINGGSQGIKIIVADKAGFNTPTRQAVGKEVVGATIEFAGGDDVVAHFGDGFQRIFDGCHAGGHCQRAHAAFHGRDPFLQHRIGGVHDAGVNIPGYLQIKQIRPMLGIVEGIGRGLVDRCHHCLGGGIHLKAGTHGKGFHLHEQSLCCCVSESVSERIKLWNGYPALCPAYGQQL